MNIISILGDLLKQGALWCWHRRLSFLNLFGGPEVSRFNPLGAVATMSVFRATIKVSRGGDLFQVRQDYRWLGTGLAGDNQGAASLIANDIRASAIATLPADARWEGVSVVDLKDPTRLFAFSTGTGGSAAGGVSGSDSEPPQLAVLMTKHTALRGQHGLGHLFWPCIPSAWISSGLINATGQAKYDDLRNALGTDTVATLSGFALRPCVAHLDNTVPTAPVVTYADVTSLTYNLTPSDRSTRKPGRGR